MQTRYRLATTYAESDRLHDMTTPDNAGQRSPSQSAPQPTPEPHQTTPRSNTTPLLPVTYFKHAGREYRLFKRQPGRDAPWYFELERAGKRIKTSTRTNDAATAATKAKAILEAADKQELAKVRGIITRRDQAAAYCTLGQVLTAFETASMEAGDQHRKNVRNCFRLAVSQACAVRTEQVDELSAAVLTVSLAQRYFEHWQKRADEAEDQEEAARAKRSANSIWRQAICLVQPRMLSIYQRRNLALPDVEPMLKAGKAERLSGSGVIVFNPPADRVIKRTLAGWRKIEERNAFLAVGLALSCGLRKSEIAQVTWGMFTRSMGMPLLDGRGLVKNQTGYFQVPPIDPFWRVLNHRIEKEKWRGEEAELVLTGTATEREEDTFRNVGAWLRDLGWETVKTNHALRAYAGSLVAMKFGIYRASAWLRHRSVKTTESHYTHFINARVFKPDRIFIRWAS